MKLQITTLIENNPDTKGLLKNEHGLSLYIEADGLNILFDTGQTGDFIHNAEVLGKDLSMLDYIIISHGHYDHSGGLCKLFERIKNHPKLLVGEEFFKQKYKMLDGNEYKFIGNSFDEDWIKQKNIRMDKISQNLYDINNNLMLFHHFNSRSEFEVINKKFMLSDHGSFVPDNFADEVSLGIKTEKGLVLIVGCSHIGIINIISSVAERIKMPIYAVIGGTHLVDADDDRIQKTIDEFRKRDMKLIAVSHCTGEAGIQKIRTEMEQEFVYNNTGNIILFE